jgi:hypothetical protein
MGAKTHTTERSVKTDDSEQGAKTDGFKQQIKTERTKQDFDRVYMSQTPILYKEHLLEAQCCISDNYNRQEFNRLILPWAKEQVSTLSFVDVGACFGNTTMTTSYDMDYDAICNNWASLETCMSIQGTRRFEAKVTAIDISSGVSLLVYWKTLTDCRRPKSHVLYLSFLQMRTGRGKSKNVPYKSITTGL